MPSPTAPPPTVQDRISTHGMMAANIVLPILATTAVLLRLLARKMNSTQLLADDYMIVTALILSITACALGIYGSASHIIGLITSMMTRAQFREFRLILYVDVLLCHLIYGIIKLSVVLFYKRIFITNRFQVFANIVMALTIGYMISATFGHAFSSHPISRYWNFNRKLVINPTSINYGFFMLAMAIIDICLDLIVLSLPVPAIKKLHMSFKRKIQLSAIFFLGGFCVIASAIRLYYTYRLIYVRDLGISPVESTYIANWNDVWAHIEACASIVTACLPTLGPLFREGRSLQSLVDSARSIFSIHSRTSLSSNRKESTDDALVPTREWEQTNPTQLTVMTSPQSLNDIEAEAQVGLPKGIVVEKSFASDSAQY